MAIAVNIEKFNEVAKLKTGDKVKLTDKSIAEFVRLKQKKFIGIINGASYDIPVNMFVELVEKAPNKTNEFKDLKEGEPFYINKNGKAILYIFKEFRNNEIIGINPISKGLTRISASLFAGKVEGL